MYHGDAGKDGLGTGVGEDLLCRGCFSHCCRKKVFGAGGGGKGKGGRDWVLPHHHFREMLDVLSNLKWRLGQKLPSNDGKFGQCCCVLCVCLFCSLVGRATNRIGIPIFFHFLLYYVS